MKKHISKIIIIIVLSIIWYFSFVSILDTISHWMIIWDIFINEQWIPDPSLDKRYIQYNDLISNIDNLESWDILFSNTDKDITSKIIPWEYQHTFIYLGNQDTTESLAELHNIKMPERQSKYYIFDATGEWVKIRWLEQIAHMDSYSTLKEISSIRIVDKELRNMFLEEVFSNENKDYDFLFNTNNDENLYCSELVYSALWNLWVQLNTDSYYNKEFITPHKLYQELQNNNQFEEIFNLRNPHNPKNPNINILSYNWIV